MSRIAAKPTVSKHRLRPGWGGVAVLAVAGAVTAAGAGTPSSGHPGPAPTASPVAPLSAATVAVAGGIAYATAAYSFAPTGITSAARPKLRPALGHPLTARRPAAFARPASVVSATDKASISFHSTGLRRLRACESGGNYRAASGNGYYGAYQFDLATWRSLGLYGLPSNAPAALQDAAALRLHARKGWGPWPVCSYVAGLR